jgi:hypothetical protein
MATLGLATWLRIALVLGGDVFPLPTAAEPPEVGGSAEPRLTIESDSTCPSGPAVLDALATLVPPAEWPSGMVRIQTDADTLAVELISDGSSTQRRLHVAADCGLRATTVALVIVTWTGQLASDAAGTPVLREQTAGTHSEVPVQAPPVTVSTPSVVATAAERELGAGLLLSVSGGIEPGVRIDFVETRAPRGLGWLVGLTLPAQRQSAAAPGAIRWTRAAANIAINGRLTLHRLVLSADLGLAGAYTFTSAYGYSIDQGSDALTGGLVAGVRLAVPWRRMRIWTDVRAYKWLFPQTIAFDALTGGRVATVELPSFDFQWAMGLAYLFR